MEITGIILRLEKTEKVSEKFQKRRIILDYTENIKFPQIIELTLIQSNVDLANKLNQGDEVKVMFNLRGKEAVDKNGIKRVYNTLEVWKIEVIKTSPDFVELPVSETENTDNENYVLPF